MAISDYAQIGDVKIVCGIPVGDTSRDDLINLLIPRVSRHIDRYCKRFFYPKTQTHKYDYQSEFKLWLRDDLHELTSITNGDGEAMDISTMFLYPINGPYQWIELNESTGITFRWAPTTQQQCLSVTGEWGYLEDDDTPEPIKDACASWISYLLKVGKLAGVKSTTIGDYSTSYSNVLDYLKNGPPNESAFYLDGYVKRRFATTSREIAP